MTAPIIPLGTRVIFETTTGPVTGVICGYGSLDRSRQVGRFGFSTMALIDLDEQFRGYIVPESWTSEDDPPSVFCSTILASIDALELEHADYDRVCPVHGVVWSGSRDEVSEVAYVCPAERCTHYAHLREWADEPPDDGATEQRPVGESWPTQSMRDAMRDAGRI